MTAPQTYSATDIITDVLQKLGIYAPGESVAASDMVRGFTTLNDMLDQWQNEYLFVFSLTTTTLTLQNQAGAYTIGPTGSATNIPTGRPNKIQMGAGAASVTIGSVTTPVNVVSQLEWSAIQSVDPGVGVPDTLFYDPQYPAGVLNVAPTPNAAMALSFYQLVPFTSFPNLNTAYAFSQGTADALKCNLAVCAKPYFNNAQIDPAVVVRSETSKEFLRTTGVTSRAMLKRSPSPVGKPSNSPPGQ